MALWILTNGMFKMCSNEKRIKNTGESTIFNDLFDPFVVIVVYRSVLLNQICLDLKLLLLPDI